MTLDQPTVALLADVVLVLHVSIAAFVVGGLGLTVYGNLRHWKWVNRVSFRLAHLCAIAVVVAEAWLGLACPLTTLEMWLRSAAGTPTYGGGFIEHWLQRVLYYDAAPWVFILGYTAFGFLVLGTWWLYPPIRKERSRERVA